jgi:hypothetical protein
MMFLESLTLDSGIEDVSKIVQYVSQKFYSDKSLYGVVEIDHITPKEIKNAHSMPRLYNIFPKHFLNIHKMMGILYKRDPEKLLSVIPRVMSRVLTYREFGGEIVQDFTVCSYDASALMKMIDSESINGGPGSFMISAWPEPPKSDGRTSETIDSDRIREILWRDYAEFLRVSIVKIEQKH